MVNGAAHISNLAGVLHTVSTWPEAERSIFMDLFVRGRSDRDTQARHGLTDEEFIHKRKSILARFRLAKG